MRAEIARYWRQTAAIAEKLPVETLETIAHELLACRERGGTVFLLGNGGSAATASHIACDLVKGTRVDGAAPFRVVALTDNVALLTAWANDTSVDRIFAEQLAPLVRPEDIVLAISASGNSPNVLAAVVVARQAGALTIALTSRGGGKLKALADLVVRVPADSAEQVEDAHLIVGHSLCVAIRAHLQDRAGPSGPRVDPDSPTLHRVHLTPVPIQQASGDEV